MPQGRTQRRVLIIDDHPDAADLLAEMLTLHDYATCVAYGGQEGLVALSRFRPEVVLLDIGMPHMDGCQVAARIRQMDQIAQPVLIAYTAWNDDRAKSRILAAGFDLHLTKPAEFKVLLDTLLTASGPLR
ncbi:two-component system, chemotaxis family, CheB/CheR fusion protein [Duganella sacchari]|uniref:Two-component system, chemotaxis family, CheB/CheR fusion protein n=1 Tax=Duganella sacchari TaxID=551987 RepID=A0A1M7R6W1_9BURK|nr:response regulator [Duganella sacchari]SHN42024.1 two-component system, chemotaxis family, CheB/CheR fusion protein [Duganella sacchari]